jgi:hypothetical protein
MTEVLWVGYPKSYTPGRKRNVQAVYLHYTAGPEGPTSAEAGAAYDKRRTDQVSTGYFTDSLGPALQEVPDGDRSHTTRFHADEIGISIEICGTVQTRAQWLDPVSLATLVTTAGLVAILLTRHGLAFKRLSVAELRRAYYSDTTITGIADHNTATLAFPEDGGTHTDVGTAFPWDIFMGLVRDALNTGGSDMAKIIETTDSEFGPGALWGTGGAGRMRLTADNWTAYAAAWAISKAATWKGTERDADRLFGQRLDKMTGQAGPEGPPGPATLVPHEHDGGPTGPARPTE